MPHKDPLSESQRFSDSLHNFFVYAKFLSNSAVESTDFTSHADIHTANPLVSSQNCTTTQIL